MVLGLYLKVHAADYPAGNTTGGCETMNGMTTGELAREWERISKAREALRLEQDDLLLKASESELEQKDIAETLGVSQQAVSKRVIAARRRDEQAAAHDARFGAVLRAL